ncbi:acetyl-CoA carboxylase biotin carboxylase subunit [Fructilactobacillus lindneri]|uniref:biotin carboxylase n=2 Tax=Fructilactobacillus lindneri TaxID=53444 RepID=A0A0R2JVL0_9LACO|nr:acetyl-CoA carboxylase biotin carboxylase subunit [Fructilactobacillus lindneri]ANZ57806.1 acetyl-CoA carboxylase biotin carboxylase subunit [Fructilactobacillus lindneri]ANZ59075.1 acetyl-CoA carboxylase biotin carboxylase subunit [Fructilactobacillus lindneri]KRN78746.1 Pyruvate carboxylase subunit A [Fructilactobacillus lindneri DSM 20690 = JCM 11027]POG98129.1 acetyl-CoA carboxylase biotin carboxylase subunit [Fructilactobacillus lindneri]POH01756.1 acetyl-CoA carboxylase biotin carboxy
MKKVLIANRGEIAVQTIRALHELNMEAVAVYSTADADGLFVKMADEAICIGSGLPTDSYLNMGAVLDAAVLTGSDAIFPGYGFLSENSDFAELCKEYGLKFIGPSAEVIDLMGNKSNAKAAMQKLGVPTIPGSDGFVKDVASAVKVAEKIGYPVMLKAAAGGGGKGIRKVNNQSELKKAFVDTKRESKLSYGDDRLYLEKDLSDAKHIEMQAIADQQGHVVFFPERDCSLQRNHQKIIEESPCSVISPAERAHMGEVVVKAMKGIHYENTGTFEFLMDREHRFYFMEMNTRLQVEHTITEEVAGVELIKAMIIVAAGNNLPFTQLDCGVKGYALECRINAEDPANNFQPTPGTIKSVHFPFGTKGVRIDSGVETGSKISPFYDSMIAKIIVHMPTKKTAVQKMLRALKEFEISGVKTNREFLVDLLQDKHFLAGDFNNRYIEDVFLKDWVSQHEEK